jgi:4-amino-4-deoxy-L-arabinose transferase-like glycosyltransferase
MTFSPDAEAAIQSREFGPFAWLLAVQIAFIGITPLISNDGVGFYILNAGVFAIILAGIYVCSETRTALVVSVALLLPAVVAWLGPDFLSTRNDELVRLLSAALCFGFTAVVMVRNVSRHERVTQETILGGINVYLLLAFAFMLIHASIAVVWPDAYTLNGRSLVDQLASAQDPRGFATTLYFSITTMTTLGYGDIVPVHAGARLMTSVQAVVGQLYVAIFIARLVSLEVSQRLRD